LVSANPRLSSIIPIFSSPKGNQPFFFNGRDLSLLKMLEEGAVFIEILHVTTRACLPMIFLAVEA
jgi:hypothetical protein